MKLFVIFPVLLLASYSDAWNLRCEFRLAVFAEVGNVYTCVAQVSSSGGSLAIENVTGDHMDGESNADVLGFSLLRRDMNFVPKGIVNFFPNLQALAFPFSNLFYVSAADLPFPDLLHFRVWSNQIYYLDSDLFRNNPKLRLIDFDRNSLQSVGPDLLTNLKDLRSVDFSNNICINQRATTEEDIKNLNIQLPISCPPLPPV